MRASIRQVAEQAQVSRQTVSRVLQGRKNEVNAETYSRVLAVMHDMNYVPVRPAVQNRQIATNTISLVPFYRNPSQSIVDSMTFEGLCDQASQSGYDLFIMLRGEAEWMANREELRFLDRRSDGFIFISPGVGEWQTALQTLVANEIPVVVCYRRDVPEGIAWVDTDNEAIIKLSVDHLVQQGHSNIVYLSGPKSEASDTRVLANLSGARDNFDDQDRIRHFHARMAELGCQKPELQVQRITGPEWRLKKEDVQRFLKEGVTGLICGDVFAIQAWNLVEELGGQVPTDLSIVSIDGQIEARHRGLTTVGFGYDDVGRAAVQAWLERQQGVLAAECCRVVPVSLVERRSVGVPHPSC